MNSFWAIASISHSHDYDLIRGYNPLWGNFPFYNIVYLLSSSAMSVESKLWYIGSEFVVVPGLFTMKLSPSWPLCSPRHNFGSWLNMLFKSTSVVSSEFNEMIGNGCFKIPNGRSYQLANMKVL